MKVSVIIATYNRAELLRRCISSLLNQTFRDFEIIVADDGSDDDTAQVVTSFNDKRIRYTLLPHKGCYYSRNSAFKLAKGKYIAVADDDDVYLRNHLKTLVDCLDSDNSIGCAYGGAKRVTPDGKLFDYIEPQEFTMPRLIWDFLIMHGTTMWRRKWMKRIKYPTDYSYAGDYIWFLFCAEAGCKFKSTGKTTYVYYMYEDSISRKFKWSDREDLCRSYVQQLIARTPDWKLSEWRREYNKIQFSKWLRWKQPKVSFLVCYYKQEKQLGKLLDVLLSQTYRNVEVVIVNDGSSHPNLSRYKDCDIKYYWHPHTVSRRATLRNMLMKISTGELLVFFDSDMVPEKDFLDKILLRHFENNKLLLVHGIFEDETPMRLTDDKPWRAMGGTFSIRKRVALSIGPFDERYNGGWGLEDTDWAYRAHQANVRIEHDRFVRINHLPHKRMDFGTRNKLLFEKKFNVGM